MVVSYLLRKRMIDELLEVINVNSMVVHKTFTEGEKKTTTQHTDMDIHDF